MIFALIYQAHDFTLVCHLCILSLGPGRKATEVKAKQPKIFSFNIIMLRLQSFYIRRIVKIVLPKQNHAPKPGKA